MTAAFESLIRRADEDRWLASRFASAEVRDRLIALYAVNFEIAHAAEAAREPGLGAIRLQWWADRLEDIAGGGGANAHPALEALHLLPRAPAIARALQRATHARTADLEAAPFADWASLERYVDDTAGLVMGLGFELCIGAPNSEAELEFIKAAARAWGLTGLWRAADHWRLRGRMLIPPGAKIDNLHARARKAFDEARAAARTMPAEAFAAFGYVALAPGYWRALERGQIETSLIGRQARLVWASARGRI